MKTGGRNIQIKPKLRFVGELEEISLRKVAQYTKIPYKNIQFTYQKEMTLKLLSFRKRIYKFYLLRNFPLGVWMFVAPGMRSGLWMICNRQNNKHIFSTKNVKFGRKSLRCTTKIVFYYFQIFFQNFVLGGDTNK